MFPFITKLPFVVIFPLLLKLPFILKSPIKVSVQTLSPRKNLFYSFGV